MAMISSKDGVTVFTAARKLVFLKLSLNKDQGYSTPIVKESLGRLPSTLAPYRLYYHGSTMPEIVTDSIQYLRETDD